jgi:phosphatidylglycerophosphate synthase
VEEYLDLIFYRPLAFLLVKAVYNTKITPDHLTFAAIIMGVAGGVFYSFGLQLTTNIGAICFLLFVVLDCSDGQLARLKKNGTTFGRLLDGASDYIVVTVIYIGIAIGYSQNEDQPSSILVLLLVSGISVMIQAMLVDFYRNRFLDIVNKRRSTFNECINDYRREYLRLKGTKSRWIEKTIIYIYLVYSRVQRNLIARKDKTGFINVASGEYYKKNKYLVRLWLIMGPSAVRTTLIICSLISRFDIYFFVTIVVFNILAAILWIVQQRIDKSYTTPIN